MKKLIISLILSVCVVSAFADQHPAESSQIIASQLVQVNTTLMQIQAALLKSPRGLDPKAFCYHDDKAYSDGAKLNGATCRRKHEASNFEKAMDDLPLYWQEDVRINSK